MQCPKCKTHQSPKEACGWCGAPLATCEHGYTGNERNRCACEPCNAASVDDLHRAIEDSRKSLNKIGEGDWTPQDTAHSVLLARIEVVLASVPFRTGRIIHGDADA